MYATNYAENHYRDFCIVIEMSFYFELILKLKINIPVNV